MITQKIELQEKFTTLANRSDGYIMMFNNVGNLVPVNPVTQGIKPQIKVVAVNASSVVCKKSGTNTNITATRDIPKQGSSVWYFNVPELATYQITATYANNVTVSPSVEVTEYKQYLVNASNRGVNI